MLDLGFVQNLILNCDDRGYNSEKYNAIVQVLKSLNINNINPMFGTDANPSISTRAYLSNQNNNNNNNSGSETVMENNNNLYLNGNTSSVHLLDQEITLHLDTVMLTQHHKLKLVDQPNRDSTITLTDSGKITSGTMVAIVDPATHKALPVGFIGEVWVYSKANAQTIRHYPASTSSNSPSSSNHSMYTAHINANKAILSDNACAHEFIKTNVYGFLYLKKDDTEPYLFIVGKFADLVQKAVACKQNVLDTYQPSLPLAPFSTSKQEEQKKNFGSLQYTSCYYYKRDIRESVMGLNNIISAVSKSQLEIFESVEVLAFENSKKVTLTLNGQKNNNNKNGRNNDGSMVRDKKKKGDEWVEIQEEEVSGSTSFINVGKKSGFKKKLMLPTLLYNNNNNNNKNGNGNGGNNENENGECDRDRDKGGGNEKVDNIVVVVVRLSTEFAYKNSYGEIKATSKNLLNLIMLNTFKMLNLVLDHVYIVKKAGQKGTGGNVGRRSLNSNHRENGGGSGGMGGSLVSSSSLASIGLNINQFSASTPSVYLMKMTRSLKNIKKSAANINIHSSRNSSEASSSRYSEGGSKRYQQMREKVDPSDWAIKSQVRAYLQGHNLEVIDYL